MLKTYKINAKNMTIVCPHLPLNLYKLTWSWIQSGTKDSSFLWSDAQQTQRLNKLCMLDFIPYSVSVGWHPAVCCPLDLPLFASQCPSLPPPFTSNSLFLPDPSYTFLQSKHVWRCLAHSRELLHYVLRFLWEFNKHVSLKHLEKKQM